MKFQVGDRVVYPPQGGGTIQGIVEREVSGEPRKYLQVVFIRGDMEVLVPLDSARQVGLRRTLGSDEFERLAEQAQGDLELPEPWPPRYRAEQEILARSDTFELARLIGTLHRRDTERGLASTEREVLETARALLASELAVVRGTSLSECENWINETLLADSPEV